MKRTISPQTIYINWQDDLFYLAYLFLFLDSMLSIYINFGDSAAITANQISQVFYLLFLGVCVLSLVLREFYTPIEILSVGGLLILGVLSYLVCNSHVFFDLTLIISIAKDIDFDKFLKRIIATFVIFLLIVFCLSGLDFLYSVVTTRSSSGQVRNSLGFGHPNTLGLLVFQLIAAVVALERKNLKTVLLWLLLALGLVFYWISRSQTLLVCVCLLDGAVLAYKWLSRRLLTARQMKVFMSIVLLIVLAAVVFIIYYYWGDPESLPWETLAGRIRQAHRYLDAYGLSAFGQEIATGADVVIPGYSAGYSYLDNGEIWYLIRLGIVGFAVFFYIYIHMIVKGINQEEFVLCIIAAVYLLYTLTENSAMRVPFNFMILYGGMMLYSEKSVRTEKAKQDKREMCRTKPPTPCYDHDYCKIGEGKARQCP